MSPEASRGGAGPSGNLAASKAGRASNAALKLGVCGEHGGDPESIALFYEAGLDYVSCSPFREVATGSSNPKSGPGSSRLCANS